MAAIKCTNCGNELTPQQAGEPCPTCGSLDRNLAAEDLAVVSEKARAAKELALRHYGVESGLARVIHFSGSPSDEYRPTEPIKLLAVNTTTIATGIMPLHFGAAPASGIGYPSVIIEVTPEEYTRIESHELNLPPGWQVGEEIPKPDGD